MKYRFGTRTHIPTRSGGPDPIGGPPYRCVVCGKAFDQTGAVVMVAGEPHHPTCAPRETAEERLRVATEALRAIEALYPTEIAGPRLATRALARILR